VRAWQSRIPVHSPREAVTLASEAISRGERVGLLFGSEKNGLSNEELACAHGIVTIPTFPGFSSLNLAQAVLLMCYEWASIVGTEDAEGSPSTQLNIAKGAWEAEINAADGSRARAPLKQLDSLFDWWEQSLWQCGFFGGGRAENSAYGAEAGAAQESTRAAAAMAKLRRVLMRAEPSVGEAALLRGALQTMLVPKAGSDIAD
jgi:tRNA C32,U32 (ribose-2'-O)-methylase TrmJ